MEKLSRVWDATKPILAEHPIVLIATLVFNEVTKWVLGSVWGLLLTAVPDIQMADVWNVVGRLAGGVFSYGWILGLLFLIWRILEKLAAPKVHASFLRLQGAAQELQRIGSDTEYALRDLTRSLKESGDKAEEYVAHFINRDVISPFNDADRNMSDALSVEGEVDQATLDRAQDTMWSFWKAYKRLVIWIGKLDNLVDENIRSESWFKKVYEDESAAIRQMRSLHSVSGFASLSNSLRANNMADFNLGHHIGEPISDNSDQCSADEK